MENPVGYDGTKPNPPWNIFSPLLDRAGCVPMSYACEFRLPVQHGVSRSVVDEKLAAFDTFGSRALSVHPKKAP